MANAVTKVLREWSPEIVPQGKYYPIPGVGKMPRVTTIIDSTVGVWGHFLQQWYAKTERAAVLETVRQLVDAGWLVDCNGADAVAAIEAHLGDGRAAVRKMEEAAEIGTQVHRHIQAYLRHRMGLSYEYPKLSPGALLATMAWEEWWDASGYKPLRIEQVVWNEDCGGYAGCIDLIVERPDGKLWLLDWKSSNYILLKHHIQVAAYLEAGSYWRDIAGATIVRVPKVLPAPGEDIKIETRELGQLYDPNKRVDFTVSFPQLMESFAAACTLYRTFIERDFGGSAGNGRAG